MVEVVCDEKQCAPHASRCVVGRGPLSQLEDAGLPDLGHIVSAAMRAPPTGAQDKSASRVSRPRATDKGFSPLSAAPDM